MPHMLQVAIDHTEFPSAWFEAVPEHMYLSRRR